MGEQTKIQWTDATWNPWYGCLKVSPGCKGCYMFRDQEFYNNDPSLIKKSKTKFNEPFKFEKDPNIKFVFTCSWSDFFLEQADPTWRDEAWQIIMKTKLTYQVLTKREEVFESMLPIDEQGNRHVPDNVWLGVSVESPFYLKRWHKLAEVKVKSKNNSKYWISVEPLLAPIAKELLNIFSMEGSILPDWIVVGGESGNPTGKYASRVCDPVWIKDIIDVCKKFGIPVFIKQLGSSMSRYLKLKHPHGGDMLEWHEDFQVRQMPE